MLAKVRAKNKVGTENEKGIPILEMPLCVPEATVSGVIRAR